MGTWVGLYCPMGGALVVSGTFERCWGKTGVEDGAVNMLSGGALVVDGKLVRGLVAGGGLAVG